MLSCYEFLMFKVKRCWFQKTSENQYITAIKLTIDFENKIIYNFWNKNMFQWLFKSTFKQVWQVCFRIFLFFLTKFYFWQKVIQKDRIQQHLDKTNQISNSGRFVLKYVQNIKTPKWVWLLFSLVSYKLGQVSPVPITI